MISSLCSSLGHHAPWRSLATIRANLNRRQINIAIMVPKEDFKPEYHVVFRLFSIAGTFLNILSLFFCITHRSVEERFQVEEFDQLFCIIIHPSGRTARIRVPKQYAGAEQFVVVMNPCNEGGVKGLCYPASHMDQPKGEEFMNGAMLDSWDNGSRMS